MSHRMAPGPCPLKSRVNLSTLASRKSYGRQEALGSQLKPHRGVWLPDKSFSKSWTQARGPRLVSTSDLRTESTGMEAELCKGKARLPG